MKYKDIKGWSKHQHFGLRREWLELALVEPETWPDTKALGNRQVESLEVWLKTAGLLDRQGQKTFLWELFDRERVDSLKAWEMLWVNVVFNFPTARWYVTELGLDSWTVRELASLLQQVMPNLAFRTIYNAVLELVGLLGRTPVGRELGQGVVSPGQPRTVQRVGHPSPSWEAVAFALQRLFREEGRAELGLEEGLLWPWIIFGCPRQVILSQLLLKGGEQFLLEQQQLAWIAATARQRN